MSRIIGITTRNLVHPHECPAHRAPRAPRLPGVRPRLLPLVALLVAASTAAPARADTVDGAAGAKVVVQRDPLRISFVAGSGRTVLRQAEPAGGFGVVPPIAE